MNTIDLYIKSIYNLDVLYFEWDENKNKANGRKHNIWFEEAVQVFDDPIAILYPDSLHSELEERFLLLGSTFSGRVLVIVHCERSKDLIRIISARKATRKEIKVYEKRI